MGFSFKQFTIADTHCAMKVGTDAVLLGAWTTIDSATHILDVGCGSGIIAIMLAQRSNAVIDAIEIDPLSYKDTVLNCAQSPWKERLNPILGDMLSYPFSKSYDLIVSNPPYFQNSLLPPNKKREEARHTTQLSFPLLFAKVNNLLTEKGTFSLIFPADNYRQIEEIAALYGFYLHRKCVVSGNRGVAPKRILASWKKIEPILEIEQQTLIIENSRHNYTTEYIALTQNFYLKM